MRQCDCLLNHQTRAKCCRNPMVSAECYAHDENACREPRSSDTHAEKLCVLRVNRMYLSIVHEEDEESVHTRSSLSALASTRPARSARWPQRQRRNSFTVVCVVCILVRTSIPLLLHICLGKIGSKKIIGCLSGCMGPTFNREFRGPSSNDFD